MNVASERVVGSSSRLVGLWLVGGSSLPKEFAERLSRESGLMYPRVNEHCLEPVFPWTPDTFHPTKNMHSPSPLSCALIFLFFQKLRSLQSRSYCTIFSKSGPISNGLVTTMMTIAVDGGWRKNNSEATTIWFGLIESSYIKTGRKKLGFISEMTR